MRKVLSSSVILFAVLIMGYISFTEKLKPGAVLAKVTAITGGRIIAAPGQSSFDDAIIIIEHGRIKSVFPRGKGEIPAGARVIDARGGSILPAFRDCSVNLLLGSAGISASLEEFLPDRVIRDLRANLYWGVTTIQSAGDELTWMARLRENELKAAILSPRLHTAGPLLTAVGGYPACYLPAKISLESTRELKDNVHSQEVITDFASRRVNALFVIFEGETGVKPYPKLSLPLLHDVIHKARLAGLRVATRIGRLDDLKGALKAGVSAVEFAS